MIGQSGQIVDGNAKTDVSNRREPGMFCGEAEQPQTFISETSYVKIIFFAENYTDQVKINENFRKNLANYFTAMHFMLKPLMISMWVFELCDTHVFQCLLLSFS